MNMDTVATLGVLGRLTQSSITVNMASGQNMGVGGDVRVTFKIGRKYSFTHKFVVCENLTRPFPTRCRLHESTLHEVRLDSRQEKNIGLLRLVTYIGLLHCSGLTGSNK